MLNYGVNVDIDVDIDVYSANANATVQCPVAPGPYEVTQSVDLPKEIPKGKSPVHPPSPHPNSLLDVTNLNLSHMASVSNLNSPGNNSQIPSPTPRVQLR